MAGVDGDAQNASGSTYYVSEQSEAPALTVSDKVDVFCAIGCGNRHASEVLESFNYGTEWPLASALYAVYCSKRCAELTPGVDKHCDIRIISSTGVQNGDERLLEQLQCAHEAEWARRKEPDAYPGISGPLGHIGL